MNQPNRATGNRLGGRPTPNSTERTAMHRKNRISTRQLTIRVATIAAALMAALAAFAPAATAATGTASSQPGTHRTSKPAAPAGVNAPARHALASTSPSSGAKAPGAVPMSGWIYVAHFNSYDECWDNGYSDAIRGVTDAWYCSWNPTYQHYDLHEWRN
jgi:hypothetical protein